MERQEMELLEGFRRLCPANKITILTVISTAVSAEEAVRREIGIDFGDTDRNYLSKTKASVSEPVQNANLGEIDAKI